MGGWEDQMEDLPDFSFFLVHGESVQIESRDPPKILESCDFHSLLLAPMSMDVGGSWYSYLHNGARWFPRYSVSAGVPLHSWDRRVSHIRTRPISRQLALQQDYPLSEGGRLFFRAASIYPFFLGLRFSRQCKISLGIITNAEIFCQTWSDFYLKFGGE